MIPRKADVIAAIKQARDLIAARGYQPLYGSATEGGPINISNALTRAATDYDLYVLCRQAFSQNWGGPVVGLVHWETYKRHTTSEALELLGEVLTRLESDEARPSGRAGRSRTDVRST